MKEPFAKAGHPLYIFCILFSLFVVMAKTFFYKNEENNTTQLSPTVIAPSHANDRVLVPLSRTII